MSMMGLPQRSASPSSSTAAIIYTLTILNPMPAMRLVEIVAGPSTSPEALSRAEEVAEKLGKSLVRVSDTPGFIVNRVARPFYLEALRIVD